MSRKQICHHPYGGSQCLYRFLDNQKNTRSQFIIPGLREIHRNPKQNKNFNSCKYFLENPLFVLKSWIWRTLGQVMNIFSYCHFHNASKECFQPKKNLNFMHWFKSAILAKLKIFFCCLKTWTSSVGYHSCRSKLYRSTSWQAALPQIFTRITLLSSLLPRSHCQLYMLAPCIWMFLNSVQFRIQLLKLMTLGHFIYILDNSSSFTF